MQARARSVAGGVLGGVVWGLWLILTPFYILFVSSLLWVPLFLWLEYRRLSRPPLRLPAVVRYGTIVAVITVAALAPVKFEDRRMGPLPGQLMTIDQLVTKEVVYEPIKPESRTIQVQLPSPQPTRREVMRCINEQTPLRASVYHCGTQATILFGGGCGRIILKEPKLAPPPAGQGSNGLEHQATR